VRVGSHIAPGKVR